MSKTFANQGLSVQQLRDIRELEIVCCRKEPLNIKLNWDMLEKRSIDQVNDFLYYRDEKLIGFLGIYALGSQLEVTGMVHPDYRRQGIFREMFQVARQTCQTRNFSRMLLVTERSSHAGIGFAEKTGSKYAFSEYRMRFENETVPVFPIHGITLRKSEARDRMELLRLDVTGFGSSESECTDEWKLGYDYDSTYVAELKGQILGKIAVVMDGENRYIFGFVIKPEERRRGYGREVLSLMLGKLLSERKAPILLEVAVENEKALSLYQSCGFKKVCIYDYFETISD